MKTTTLVRLVFVLLMVFTLNVPAIQAQTRGKRNKSYLQELKRRTQQQQQQQQQQGVPFNPATQTNHGMGNFASTNNLQSQFDAIVQQHYEEFNCPGVSVLVAQDGQIVYRRHMGFADVASQKPLNDHSVYRLASVSKLIAGVLALKMSDLGELNLDAKAKDYIFGLPSHQTATIRQLATLRGGQRDYGDPQSPLSPNDFANTQYTKCLDMAPNIWHDPLVVSPGMYYYGPYGLVLLGAAMEKATGGISTPNLIRSRLSIPLGLGSLRAEDVQVNRPNRVTIYDDNNNPVARDNITYKFLAGGLESSPLDLLKFGMKLIDGQILSPSSMQLLTNPVTQGEGYTYGATLSTYNGNLMLTRSGGQLGASSYIWMAPDRRMVGVVLVNRKSGGARTLALDLRNAFFTQQRQTDLIVSDFKKNGNPYFSGGHWHLPLKVTFKNNGQARMPNKAVNGIRLGTKYRWSAFMQPLAPGASTSNNVVLKVPDAAKLLQGRKLTLVAMADAPIAAADTSVSPNGRVNESNDNNNERNLQVLIPSMTGNIVTNNNPNQNGLTSGGNNGGNTASVNQTGPQRTNPKTPEKKRKKGFTRSGKRRGGG